MGAILNKLNPNSSTASGSDDDGPSGIVKSAVIALIGMLMLSTVLTGSGLAASISGVVAEDPTYGSDGDGNSEQYIDLTNVSATSGEQITVTINDTQDQNIDLNNISSQVTMASWASVNSITVNGDTATITVDVTSNTSDSTLTLAVDGYKFSGPGTATVTTGGAVSEYSDTFSYDEPQGTIAVGNIMTSDGTSFSNLSGERLIIEDSSGTEVVNTTNFSESYSTQVASGENYTVRYTADHYDESVQTVSVSYNTTSTVDLSLQRTQVDYEFTVLQDGNALDVFDFSLFSGAESDVDFQNDTAIASTSVNSSQSNTVKFAGLSDGKQYSGQITYDNGTTYTFTFTADSSADDDGDGVVSQTIDVAGGDTFGFIGSSSDYSFTDVAMYVGGAFIVISTIIGGLFILLWTKNGLKFSNL